MHSKFKILLALMLLCSCQNTERRPAGILSREEMVKALAEVYIAEEKVQRLSLSMDSSKQISEVMRAIANEKTGVSDSIFKKSFEYYMDHPKDMEMIYTVLVDSLQLREQRATHRTVN